MKCEMRLCQRDGKCHFPENCGPDGFILDYRMSALPICSYPKCACYRGDYPEVCEDWIPSWEDIIARVVKLADTTDLKSVGHGRAGSNPASGTISNQVKYWKCTRCQTEYFKPQDCDWCNGEVYAVV